MCGFSGSTAAISSRVSDPSPPELIDVVTSSVATTGEVGSSNLACTSAAQCEWTSPVSTTALRTGECDDPVDDAVAVGGIAVPRIGVEAAAGPRGQLHLREEHLLAEDVPPGRDC